MTGRRWKAVLLHPGFNRRHDMHNEGFQAHSESEARRQAWRIAILNNLAGFKIVAWPLLETDQ